MYRRFTSMRDKNITLLWSGTVLGHGSINISALRDWVSC